MPRTDRSPVLFLGHVIRGIGLCAMAAVLTSQAQTVLSPPPPGYGPQLPEAPGIRIEGQEPESIAGQAAEAGQSALEWGIAKFRPRVFYRFSYGDDLPYFPGQGTNSVIQEVTPGISLRLGDKWGIDYTPTFRFYSNEKFSNTWENRVIFAGGTTYEDWAFGLSQSYANTDQPRYETARQTEQEDFNTALTAMHELNSKLGLQLGLNQDLRFSPDYPDSYQWSTTDYLNYLYASELTFGIGPGFGYVMMSEGLDMMFEQVNGQVTWKPGSKLTAHASVGVDFRQFVDAGVPTAVNPIYGLDINYQLFEPTTLSVSGMRTVDSSYFVSEFVENTTISGAIRQRLLKHFNLGLSGGYRISSYVQATPNLDTARHDDGFFFQARLGTALFKQRVTTSIFYSWRQNSSDAHYTSDAFLYNYSTSEIGFELGYRF